MKDNVNAVKTPHRWIILIMPFLVICGIPSCSSWLGSVEHAILDAILVENPKYKGSAQKEVSV
jgi:hypothetical protein